MKRIVLFCIVAIFGCGSFFLYLHYDETLNTFSPQHLRKVADDGLACVVHDPAANLEAALKANFKILCAGRSGQRLRRDGLGQIAVRKHAQPHLPVFVRSLPHAETAIFAAA